MTDRSVTIELDRVRHLRYTFNDIADIEDALGMYFPDIVQAGFSFKITRALLWGGLKWEDKTLRTNPAGLLNTGDLINEWTNNGGNLSDLYNKCGEGLIVSGLLRSEPSDTLRS
jgi:hypothetical protein